ncbi:MAG TPA: hypothetical protein VK760_04210 [Candidatus Acidoferrales bacterium]|jgi:hypothetical protein|nr:hypothetical protein [Candidatus Acidoferrales bacterium]
MNKTLAIVLTVLWGIIGLISTVPAVMSVMLFDAPGAAESNLTWAFFWCLAAMPFCWFLGAGVPWLFRNKKFGIWLYAIPFVDLCAIAALFAAIDRYCGGMLSCK